MSHALVCGSQTRTEGTDPINRHRNTKLSTADSGDRSCDFTPKGLILTGQYVTRRQVCLSVLQTRKVVYPPRATQAYSQPNTTSAPMRPGLRARCIDYYIINLYFSYLSKIPLTEHSFCTAFLSTTIAKRIMHNYCYGLEETGMIAIM